MRNLQEPNRFPSEHPVLNEKLFGPLKQASFGEKEAAGPAKKAKGDGLEEGILLFETKKWAEALRHFLPLESGDAQARGREDVPYYVGLCLVRLGRGDEALPYLEKAVTAAGNALRTYQCRMTAAYVHALAGRMKTAEFELNGLLESGFESAQLFNTLAYAAYTRKNYRHALKFYEKALSIDEDNATALNCMGYILVDAGINPPEGLRMCRRAVELKPENAAYVDSLGWACHKCGDAAEARGLIRKALDLAPQEKTVREHYRIVTGGDL